MGKSKGNVRKLKKKTRIQKLYKNYSNRKIKNIFKFLNKI